MTISPQTTEEWFSKKWMITAISSEYRRMAGNGMVDTNQQISKYIHDYSNHLRIQKKKQLSMA